MADEQGEGHPILSGIVALVAVALVVGAILGGGALAAAKLTGVDGGKDAASDASTRSATLSLPPITDSANPNGNDITLATTDLTRSGSPSRPSAPTSEPSAPDSGISLSAGETEVSAMQQIDLTGTYPGGEGAVLQVQRFEGGRWSDFPVTASVSNETFSTYIQTGQTGRSRFRVVDTDSDTTSNVVKVTIH